MTDYLHGTDVLVGSPLGPGYYIGNATSRTLKKGMQGEDVRVLQQALINAGFPVGSKGADGAFGNDTFSAVWNFQKSKGLPSVDGIAGSDTLIALNITRPTTSVTPAGSTAASTPNVPGSSPSVSEGSFWTHKYGPFPVYGWGCLAVSLGFGAFLVWPRQSL